MKKLFKILYSTKHLWPYYAIIIVCSLLLAVILQVAPFVIKVVADLCIELIKGQQVDFFIGFLLSAIWFGSDLFSALFLNCIKYCSDVLNSKLNKFFSEQCYDKLLSLPYEYYSQNSTGEVVDSFKKYTHDLSNDINYLFKNLYKVLSITFSFFIVAHYSFTIALLMFLAYLISTWLSFRANKIYEQNQEYKEKCSKTILDHIEETLSQIKIIKSFVQEKRELLHLKHQSQQCVEISCAQSRQYCSMDILRRSVIGTILFISVSYLFWQTLRVNFTLGEMILIIQFINILRIALLKSEDGIGNFKKIIDNSNKYYQLVNLEPQDSNQAKGKNIKIQKGKIVFNNVSFKDLLKNISFKIKPGVKLVVVAENIQSSNAIINLMMLLSKPNSGFIAVDDVDISFVKVSKLRDSITFIDQATLLSSNTIRQNIAYSKPDATDKILHSAARSAMIHDYIEKLPDDYNSNNPKLSDNQKYRILIARAFIKNSPILIINEPKFRLDSTTKKALSSLMKGRTTIILASRFSTVSSADVILTLENGKINEYGSPRKLTESGGIYTKLLSFKSRDTNIAKDKLMGFNLTND